MTRQQAGSPTSFVKMHGAGNDFAVLDARARELALSPARIRLLSDRRTGIGWDQLIVLDHPTKPGADVLMRIHNPDGSEAGACGNATRCVALLLAGETGRDSSIIESGAGLLDAHCLASGDVCVDMGVPRLGWADIPLSHACDTLHLPLAGDPAAASMGNPHATYFLADISSVDPHAQGPGLEYDPLFPDRANIGFAQIVHSNRIRLRVWERGAGLTRACGTGACAALVNAHRRGLADRRAEMLLDGGTLLVEWRDDDHVLMTGPAVVAFQGTVDLSTYPA